MTETERGSSSLVQVTDLLGLSEATKTIVTAIGRGLGFIAEPIKARLDTKVQISNFQDWNKALHQQGLGANAATLNLAQRASMRLSAEVMHKQINREQIAAHAIDEFNELDASEQLVSRGVDELGLEWIDGFWSRAENISSSDLQTLWGRVLARSTSGPEIISTWALDILSKMSKKDAETLQITAAFCCEHKIDETRTEMGILTSPKLYASNQLTPETAEKHNSTVREIVSLLPEMNRSLFEAIGIYRESDWAHGFYQNPGAGNLSFSIAGRTFELDLSEAPPPAWTNEYGGTINFASGIGITELGAQIFGLAKTEPNPEYVKHLRDAYALQGVKMSPL